MFKSNAEWSRIMNTEDKHNSYEFAKNICNILKNDYNKYTPCDIRGVCLKAWVTDENDNIIYEA